MKRCKEEVNWKFKNYENPLFFTFVTYANIEAITEKIYGENEDDGKSRT